MLRCSALRTHSLPLRHCWSRVFADEEILTVLSNLDSSLKLSISHSLALPLEVAKSFCPNQRKKRRLGLQSREHPACSLPHAAISLPQKVLSKTSRQKAFSPTRMACASTTRLLPAPSSLVAAARPCQDIKDLQSGADGAINQALELTRPLPPRFSSIISS